MKKLHATTLTKIKPSLHSEGFILVAIDRTTWNSIKSELVMMWRIVTDYQKIKDDGA